MKCVNGWLFVRPTASIHEWRATVNLTLSKPVQHQLKFLHAHTLVLACASPQRPHQIMINNLSQSNQKRQAHKSTEKRRVFQRTNKTTGTSLYVTTHTTIPTSTDHETLVTLGGHVSVPKPHFSQRQTLAKAASSN